MHSCQTGQPPADTPPSATACCGGQGWCTVRCTTQWFARKWHPVIVHQLLENGTMGFTAPGAHSIVHRQILPPLRVQYQPTPAGEALRPVGDAMQAWGQEQLPCG